MPDNETTNPYKANLDQLIDKFNEKFRYLIVSDQEKYPETITSEEVGDWNKNVDLYWKWEAGGNQPSVDPDDPDPTPIDPGPTIDPDIPGGDDLPMNIIVNRNDVVVMLRRLKVELLNAYKTQKILNQEEWTEEDEHRYDCLDEAEDRMMSLPPATISDNWTPCTESLPDTFTQVFTVDEDGYINKEYLESKNPIKWSTDKEIVAWMTLPLYVPD